MTHTERGIHDPREYGPGWPGNDAIRDEGSPGTGMALSVLAVVLVVVALIALTLAA